MKSSGALSTKQVCCPKCKADLGSDGARGLSVIVRTFQYFYQESDGTRRLSRPEVSHVDAVCANCGLDVFDVEMNAAPETKDAATKLMADAREAYHSRS